MGKAKTLNWTAINLKPIYKTQGVLVTLTVGATVYPNIRALDKTSGITLAGPIELETTRPMAAFMAADLVALGFSIGDGDIDQGRILMNGKNWNITSTKPMPSPQGYNDGELYAYLEEAIG